MAGINENAADGNPLQRSILPETLVVAGINPTTRVIRETRKDADFMSSPDQFPRKRNAPRKRLRRAELSQKEYSQRGGREVGGQKPATQSPLATEGVG